MASDSIPDKMVISLKGKGALYKGDLMMLEMIANANWTRPIYVALTVGAENYMNLGDNFVQGVWPTASHHLPPMLLAPRISIPKRHSTTS